VRRSDAVANRAALLDAARRLYSKRGLAVPYEEIAREAGVGRATLYRHFPDRDQLLVAVLDRLVEELEETADATPPGPGRFFAIFDSAVRLQERNLGLIDLIPSSAKPPKLVRALRGRMESVFAEPLREAQDDDLVRGDVTIEDVRILLSMMAPVIRPRTPADEAGRARELARAALRPRSAPRPEGD
jgi:AcrR family transcriptional regulator